MVCFFVEINWIHAGVEVTHVNRLGERLFSGIPWIVAGGVVLKERSRVHLFVSRMISTSKDGCELLLCENDGVTLHLR